MGAPEIIWTESRRGGSEGRIGTLSSVVMSYHYRSGGQYVLRSTLPGHTSRDLKKGTPEELQVFAQKLVHVWFARAYGERFGDAVKSA